MFNSVSGVFAMLLHTDSLPCLIVVTGYQNRRTYRSVYPVSRMVYVCQRFRSFAVRFHILAELIRTRIIRTRID